MIHTAELLSTEFPVRPGDVSEELESGLHERWSPRRYDGERDVAGDDLRAILEAARWAPSCFGEEPWRFIVARRSDPWRGRVDSALKEGNAWARRAGVLVVGAAKDSFSRNDKPNRWSTHDLGIALGHMMVEAKARGLITHAMGGFDADSLRADFGVPEDHDILWVLAIGHYDPALDDEELARSDQRPRGRRPLSETVFGGSFGEAVEL